MSIQSERSSSEAQCVPDDTLAEHIDLLTSQIRMRTVMLPQYRRAPYTLAYKELLLGMFHDVRALSTLLDTMIARQVSRDNQQI